MPWAVGLFFLIAAGALIILWVALPFSLFGIKGLLRELIDEQKRNSALLMELKRELTKGGESGMPREKPQWPPTEPKL
ncbi:MAG: hypothetical protein ACE5D4_02950 [Thermodesulfobacteriota bacterium]